MVNELACDALLFDLDGVLIDSSACIVRNWPAAIWLTDSRPARLTTKPP